MATVPTAAVDWIIQYLGTDLPDWKARIFKERDLNDLSVRQLKMICHAVEPHTAFPRPPSHAKKAFWVAYLRRVFYDDVNCLVPNMTILDQLPTAPYYAVARAPAASSPHPSHSPARQAIAHPPQAVAHPRQAATGLPHPRQAVTNSRQAAAHRQRAARHPPCASYAGSPPMQYMAPAYYPLPLLPPTPALPAAHLSASSPARPTAPFPASTPARPAAPTEANKKVKREPNDSSMWEAHARTAQEHIMVSQLRQMGFTDMREMLAGIRHISSTDMTSQVEAAMMWIVSQREEVEEARKVDAARARSEMLRAEQAKLRKEAAHERLWGTSLDDWLSQTDLFRGSVVLSEARVRLEPLITDNNENKEELIKFLELEKKARKWYGTSVPWRYLCDMSERWKQLSSDEVLVKNIENEANVLEAAMYSLSEQQGGVPRLFLEARCSAEKNGLPVSPREEGAFASVGDDDVIVVKELPAFQGLSRANSSASNGKKGEVEVIEIF